MYRKTYVEVNKKNIEYNVSKIIKDTNYQYYIAVVKANCYNHGINIIENIIKKGSNYLATSSLDEALIIRKTYKDIPILILEPINLNDISICIKNNLTITITSLNYLKQLKEIPTIHLKLDTGMNRLGIKDIEELKLINEYLINKNIKIEGIYSHIYHSNNKERTLKQINLFKEMLNYLPKAKIIHLPQSETIINYKKEDFINGCRLGIIMYGLINNEYKSTYKLITEVIEIKKVLNEETISYNGNYTAKKDHLIAILPIGYADGLIRKNTNRYVYINNNKYQIIGNICMDLTIIKIDDKVNLYDKVEIIKDNNHINEISNHLDTINYEVLTQITSRVPITYIN